MQLTLLLDLHKCSITSFDYNIIEYNTKDTILLQVCGQKADLVLTDTDQSIAYWKEKNIPIIAWSHRNNAGESLMATPWLILSLDALSHSYLEETYCHFHGIPYEILKTDRCLIRELSPDDYENLISLDSQQDKESAGRFFKNPSSRNKDFLKSYCHSQYSFYGLGIYGAWHKETGKFLGIAGFSTTEDSHLEIGYAVRKEERRKGYAKEWIMALTEYAREYYEVDEVFARIQSHNTASIKTAKSCGLTILEEK